MLSRAEGSPPLTGYTPPNTAQGTTSFLCHKRTSLAHILPGAHWDRQGPFCKAALQLVRLLSVWVPGVIPPQVQDLVLLLAELHEVPGSPFLQLAEVPLVGSTTLWHISHSSQFCVLSKLAQGTLCCDIQIINADDKQDWIQHGPLGYNPCHWPPDRLCTTGHHDLDPFVQPVFNPAHRLIIKPTLHQLVCNYPCLSSGPAPIRGQNMLQPRLLIWLASRRAACRKQRFQIPFSRWEPRAQYSSLLDK